MISKPSLKMILYLTPWVYGVLFISSMWVAAKFFKPDGSWSSTANLIGDTLFYLLYISGFLALGIYVLLTRNKTSIKTVLFQFLIQSINMCFFWFAFFLMIDVFGFLDY
jgi:hypothetical protein